MGLISPTLPTIGQARGDGEAAVRNTLTALLNEFNGNISSANIMAGGIQSSDLASDVLRVKTYPATVIATEETHPAAGYGLMPTPDRVSSVVLPSNGLILVAYQAMWQETVNGAADAAIFLNTDQLKIGRDDVGAPTVQSAALNGGAGSIYKLLTTHTSFGLYCNANTTPYTGDVTTGQILGHWNGVSISGATGGMVPIFAAAGTYDVSVRFNATAGNVIAKNRSLRVAVMNFS